MKRPHRLSISPERRRHLVRVARGEVAPDTVVRAPEMLDIYTGEIRAVDIGIAAGRIAWVDDIGARAVEPVVDTSGGVVVPGLVEPHCHPDVVYNPAALGVELARHGTTTVCADTAFLSLLLGDDELYTVLRGLGQASVKFLWNLRGCLDGVLPAERARLSGDRLERLLDELPDLVATGEMTAWPDLLTGDARLCGLVDAATERGLRIDGHAAGASARTLGPLAAAGITADHEAITVDELVARARLGYWLMLRHSSLRPDGPTLAEAVTSARVPVSRAMLTTDGPVAADLVDGHLDHVIRLFIGAGVPAVDAVRMATLNPAVYLGLDAHVGGIAPGRAADLVVVDSLETFHPRLVMCDGVVVTDDTIEAGFEDWAALHGPPIVAADLGAGALVEACLAGPSMYLDGVITRVVSPGGPGDSCYAALVARDGSWIVGGTIQGLDIVALASTFSGSGDVVVIGCDVEACLTAYEEVVARGGGIATHARTLPLVHLGAMYGGSVQELASTMRDIAGDLRLPPGLPPLEYLLLFLAIAVLPDVRLTPVGAMRVKTREVLQAPIALARRTATKGPG